MNLSSGLDSNLKVMLLRINGAPSLKAKVKNEAWESNYDQLDEYWTAHLAFDLDSKELLCHPYYICGFCDRNNPFSCAAGCIPNTR